MFDELTRWLFNPAGLTPHGFCLLWEPSLLWLHALSDIGIGLAYFAIPFALLAFIRHRPDLVFRPVFALFAAFILLCGAGHWLAALTLWVPAYGIEGIVKAATAVTSVLTAVAVWWLLPKALAIPSAEQVRKLHADITEGKLAELRLVFAAREASMARDGLARQLARSEAAERQLRESEERYHVLLQSNLMEPLYLLAPDGIVESWNASAERLKGYTAAEIVGRDFAAFFTPEDVASGAPARGLATASERGRFTTEAWRVRKDGSRFIARNAIDTIRRDDGSVRGFVMMTQDITAKRIEDEQRAIIIEAAPNGMMIVNETGAITLVNAQAEKIFGYANGMLIGQPVEILVPEGFQAAHGALRSAFTSGRSDTDMPPQRQFTGRKQDGSAVIVEIMLSPVRTPHGRIVIAALFDITERMRLLAERQATETAQRIAAEETAARLDRLSQHLVKARDRAEEANRAKSRFLAGMSHELRTPLNGILGYAHLLHMEGGLTVAQTARLDAMLAAGKHLLEMITCILDLSEIEAGHVQTHLIAFDVKAVVAACIDLVRPMAEAKNLALSLVVQPDMPRDLVADATRLRQILLNLLGNAAKFTSHGTIGVNLSIIADGTVLRIEVVDSGRGIPVAQRDRLFQDFERLDIEATGKVEGAGLGLALSARLATLMEGRLGHDDNPNGGSVFWLELPLDAAAVSGPGTDEAPPDASPVLRVLLVDDVLMNRDIAGSFLRASGHTVICAESGQQAVAAAADADFDVVLMDVRMPEMDGLEASRRIRSLDGARGQVPIVALTAQAFTDQIAECRAAGMDSHLAKPFDPPTLLDAVIRAVAAGHTPGKPFDAVRLPPPAAMQAVLGADLPVFDRIAFQRTAAFLDPSAIAGYLRQITDGCEGLMRGSEAPDARVRVRADQADAAHALAGPAGLFGFQRLASLCLMFERTAEAGPAVINEAAVIAGLHAAIQASLLEIRAIAQPETENSRIDAAVNLAT